LVQLESGCVSLLSSQFGLHLALIFVYVPLGKISDITLFRNNSQNLDAKQRFLVDKAYIGEEFIPTPYKKPKKAELSEIQKGENKKI
jgi:hypothetical protein